jgi:hypothetical protein
MRTLCAFPLCLVGLLILSGCNPIEVPNAKSHLPLFPKLAVAQNFGSGKTIAPKADVISVPSVTGFGATIFWAADKQVDHYEIQRADYNSSVGLKEQSFTTIGTLSGADSTSGESSSILGYQYTDGGISNQNGNTYCYQVISYDSSGGMQPSDSVLVVTSSGWAVGYAEVIVTNTSSQSVAVCFNSLQFSVDADSAFVISMIRGAYTAYVGGTNFWFPFSSNNVLDLSTDGISLEPSNGWGKITISQGVSASLCFDGALNADGDSTGYIPEPGEPYAVLPVGDHTYSLAYPPGSPNGSFTLDSTGYSLNLSN